MKLSEKIKELQEIKKKHGDLELMQPYHPTLSLDCRHDDWGPDEKWEPCQHSPIATLRSGKKVVWL